MIGQQQGKYVQDTGHTQRLEQSALSTYSVQLAVSWNCWTRRPEVFSITFLYWCTLLLEWSFSLSSNGVAEKLTTLSIGTVFPHQLSHLKQKM